MSSVFSEFTKLVCNKINLNSDWLDKNGKGMNDTPETIMQKMYTNVCFTREIKCTEVQLKRNASPV